VAAANDVTWFGFGDNDETGLGDSVAVNDLSGTGVVHFTPDFADPSDNTGPNNNSDQLEAVGTAGVDHLTVSGSGANTTMAGLTPLVTPVNLHTPCGSTPLTATTSWTAPASKPAWFSSRYANVRLAALASRSPRQR
jgi:hypothetical protein